MRNVTPDFSERNIYFPPKMLTINTRITPEALISNLGEDWLWGRLFKGARGCGEGLIKYFSNRGLT